LEDGKMGGGSKVKNLNSSGGFRLSNLICHRMPERTFKIKGHYFPVCSRCTGFYLGAFFYFIYAYYFYVDYTLFLLLVAFLMILPSFLDGFTQLIGSRETQNTLRIITGLFGGIGLAILFKALKWIILTFGII
jgi:uncharacterized membrane protein